MKPVPAIVYIITKLELGGAQKVCLTLFKELRTARYTTYLISGPHGPLVPHIAQDPHALLLPAFARAHHMSLRLKQEIRAFIDLVKVLRSLRKKHSVIAVHTHSSIAGILGRWAALCAGVKVRIHTIHGFGFHPHQSTVLYSCFLFIEWITALITSHFVCVSAADQDTGQKFLPAFKQRSSIIRAAIDMAPFKELPNSLDKAENTWIIGSVACFKKQKNLFDLLQAFEYIYRIHPYSRLELIGDGTLRPAIEEWIRTHDLSSVVKLHGWQKEVVPLMKQWHCFALTSLWEGLPCAVIEARCLKLPVVSYHTGGIPEVIFHEKNGLLYPQKEWQALAEGILQLQNDPLKYRSLAQYKDNLEPFANEYMLQQHALLYQQLFR
jgi:glycosyltransferase involved in cell wall biosynthesis